MNSKKKKKQRDNLSTTFVNLVERNSNFWPEMKVRQMFVKSQSNNQILDLQDIKKTTMCPYAKWFNSKNYIEIKDHEQPKIW